MRVSPRPFVTTTIAGLLLLARLAMPAQAVDTREELTGDWGGARTRLKERGITLEGSWTQFYQAVVGGGLQRGGEYGGKIILRASFDTGRLKFWPNGTFNLLLSTRYGDSAAPL